jgi:hypothetical protein
VVEDWETTPIALQRESDAWRKTISFIREFRHVCDPHLLVNTPVLSAGLDALAALRDPEKLLLDLLDRPAQVARALQQVRQAYHEIAEELAGELDWDGRGSCNWLGMYHPRRINTLQCDFSCMISAALFEAFQVPCLVEEARHYDAVAYHLDGPQAAHQLPAICRIDAIAVVQYVPIPSETAAHVENVYEQALALGKGVIRPARCEQALDIWRRWPDRKLIFTMWLPTRDEALRVLERFASAAV